jgi:hypothetical protein
VWDRCDAECSPERGYYHHPSRHSAGQPIVAGWAYQFIAQLNFSPATAGPLRWTWSACAPGQDANEVAAEQVKAFVRRSLEEEGDIPLFVFDAGYDPVKLQQRLEGQPVQILVRLRAVLAVSTPIRASLAHLPTLDGRAVTGRRCEVRGPEHLARTLYGVHMRGLWLRDGVRARLVRAASEGSGARRTRCSRRPLPIVVGTLVLVEVERLPRTERRCEPKKL